MCVFLCVSTRRNYGRYGRPRKKSASYQNPKTQPENRTFFLVELVYHAHQQNKKAT